MTDIESTVLHFCDVAREPGTEDAMYLPVKDARVITGEITRLRAIAKACEEGGRISAYLTEQSIKDQAETNGELIRLRDALEDAALIFEKTSKALGNAGQPGLAIALLGDAKRARAVIATAKGENK